MLSEASVEKSINEIWKMFRETDKRFKETDRRLDERFQETDERFKATDRQLKELGKQIGGLGNKFGVFTEGMAFPSMRRILRERFNMEYFRPYVEIKMRNESIELDVLSYSNENIKEVYIVEVKSRLKEEHIQEMLRDLKRFPRFFPEHRDKALYGIMAAVNVSDQMKKRVLDNGLYLAVIRNDTFNLEVPEGFKARRFN